MDREVKPDIATTDAMRDLAVATIQLTRKLAKDPAGQMLATESLKAILESAHCLSVQSRNGVGETEACDGLRKAIFCFEVMIEGALASEPDVLPVLDKSHRLCAELSRVVREQMAPATPTE